MRSSLLGMVMLWATDFLPLWKKVSGVQILLAIKLLRRSMAMGPLNFNLSSTQLCLKNTSMVYSYVLEGEKMQEEAWDDSGMWEIWKKERDVERDSHWSE